MTYPQGIRPRRRDDRLGQRRHREARRGQSASGLASSSTAAAPTISPTPRPHVSIADHASLTLPGATATTTSAAQCKRQDLWRPRRGPRLRRCRDRHSRRWRRRRQLRFRRRLRQGYGRRLPRLGRSAGPRRDVSSRTFARHLRASVGSNVVLDFGSNDVLTLDGVSVHSLSSWHGRLFLKTATRRGE